MSLLARAPIRLRLTLWYVFLLAVVLGAFAAGVYLFLRHTLYQNLDESIESRSATLLNVVQFEGDRPTLSDQVLLSDLKEREEFVRVFDSEGNLSFDGTSDFGEVAVDSRALAAGLAGESTIKSVKAGAEDDPLRVLSSPMKLDGTVVGVLEVGRSEGDVSDTLSTLLLIMGIAYPVTLAIASFGGVFLAGRALTPVGNITRAARQISAEDLSKRLDMQLPDDEVGELARTFDEMIARLEDAFRRQRRFAADASHELRTPLTVIKGQIEVSLQKDREPETYRHVLQAVNEEVDRLIRLATSLLTLTRADAGQIPLTWEKVNLGDILIGVADQVRSSADDKGVRLRLEVTPPVTVQADEDLLIQLVLNLLDNSIKYTPQGGEVEVTLTANGHDVELRVKDTGLGIPHEHLPYLFDRFYRVDKARSRSDGGVGLGLAISHWIVQAHGGSISVDSTPKVGSTFTVILPTQR